MYCNNCGNRLMGNEKYCPNCGSKTFENSNSNIDIVANESERKSTEGYRSASIILGGLALGGVFFGIFAPVSVILSIIGLILAIKSNRNVKNTPGIVLNAIGLFLSVIITIAFILFIWFVFSVVDDNDYDFNNMYNDYINRDYKYDNHGDF